MDNALTKSDIMKGINNMKETIEWENVCDLMGTAVAIERTPDFFQVAQQLSEFIYGLQMDQPTNDRLVALMVDQVQQAEKGAFAHGFRMGMEFDRHEQHPDIPRKVTGKLPTS